MTINIRKVFLFSAVALISLFFQPSNLSAGWLYSSKTGKWMNLSKQAKSTPKEQFDYAKSLEDKKEYKAALKEYNIFIHNYADSPLAAEVNFRIGICYENLQQYYKASKRYSEIMDIHLSYENIDEVIARQYNIGNLFMAGERRKVLGFIPSLVSPETIAERIYTGIIDNATRTEYAVKSVYKLGEIKLKNKDYEKATEMYKKIIDNYKDSEYKEAASYKIAYCKYMTSKSADYEQKTTLEAIKVLMEFIKGHPNGKFTPEAIQKINDLKGRYAASLLEKGDFYLKNGRTKSALIYYEAIVKEFGDTESNKQAMNEIEKLKQKIDKEPDND